MNPIRKSPIGLVLALVIMVTAFGCKSNKKAMEAASAKAKLEQEMALKKQREDEMKRKEAEEKDREAEARRLRDSQPKVESATPNEVKLEKYFAAISGSANVTSANSSIDEALTLFASPSVPVLIVISEANGQKDYDRPTTIKDYLNYLKDQRKNINAVSDLKTDVSGKIIEVELKKNL